MTRIEREILDFQQFALKQMPHLPSEATLDDVVDLWKREHNESDKMSDLEAIREAVEDFKNGDRGIPAGEMSRDLRKKLKDIG